MTSERSACVQRLHWTQLTNERASVVIGRCPHCASVFASCPDCGDLVRLSADQFAECACELLLTYGADGSVTVEALDGETAKYLRPALVAAAV